MIDHPRVGGALLGYFNAVGYDPATGMVSRPGMYFEDFSLLEVFNDSGFDENESGVVQDWFSLLTAGR